MTSDLEEIFISPSEDASAVCAVQTTKVIRCIKLDGHHKALFIIVSNSECRRGTYIYTKIINIYNKNLHVHPDPRSTPSQPSLVRQSSV